MGVWGPAIFSDDTASDIRSEYRDLLEDQVPDEEATQRILHSYKDLDDDEVHVLWLALAAAQQQAVRLEDRVRDEALRIIDTGEGLEYWAEEADDGDGADLKKRKAALQALRTKLTGPQPSRKKIRRPYRPTTDLVPGDLLSYTPEQGPTLVFRVIGVESNRHFEAPVMQRLDWTEHTTPTFDQAVALPDHPGAPRPDGSVDDWCICAGSGRKKDPDWQGIGMQHLGRQKDWTAVDDAHYSFANWAFYATQFEHPFAQERLGS